VSVAELVADELAAGLPLCVPIREEVDVVVARRQVRELAARLGLPEAATGALAIAVSEVARNIVVHAGSGALYAGLQRRAGHRGLLVLARDRGGGIADLELAMRDGYSGRGGGLGLGLPSARRLVDELELWSAPGEGTTVLLWKRLP
jgi:serine/threonine-protein kinase RsbT